MQSTVGGAVTSFCSDCYCGLSNPVDEENAGALFEASRTELAEKKRVLALHNAKTDAAEALWRQMQADSRLLAEDVFALEESTGELSLRHDAVKKHNRMCAVRQTGEFRPVHSAGGVQGEPPPSVMSLELETIRALCRVFLDTMDENYEKYSFLSYKFDTWEGVPDPKMRSVYTMIRNIKIFNEGTRPVWAGYMGCPVLKKRAERPNILCGWRRAAECLLRGTFLFRDAGGSEHIFNVAAWTSLDWDARDAYFDALIPSAVLLSDGVPLFSYDGGLDDGMAFYMQTLASSSGILPNMRVPDMWIPPPVGGGFKQLMRITDEACTACVVETFDTPSAVVVKLNAEY